MSTSMPRQELRYTPQQFAVAYKALVHICHGLANIHMDEIIRNVRAMTALQDHRPETIDNTERLLEILEAAKVFREVMKAKGVPRMPVFAQPDQPQVVRQQTGTA
jgi:hypothetical protein